MQSFVSDPTTFLLITAFAVDGGESLTYLPYEAENVASMLQKMAI